MKTVVLGEVLFELFEKLKQTTSFGWPPFPTWDELKDFQFVFERLNGLFHFPLFDAAVGLSLASAERGLLTLQGWELPSAFIEIGIPRERNLTSPFDDAFAVLEQIAVLSKKATLAS
jgi:hypothetical protein